MSAASVNCVLLFEFLNSQQVQAHPMHQQTGYVDDRYAREGAQQPGQAPALAAPQCLHGRAASPRTVRDCNRQTYWEPPGAVSYVQPNLAEEKCSNFRSAAGFCAATVVAVALPRVFSNPQRLTRVLCSFSSAGEVEPCRAWQTLPITWYAAMACASSIVPSSYNKSCCWAKASFVLCTQKLPVFTCALVTQAQTRRAGAVRADSARRMTSLWRRCLVALAAACLCGACPAVCAVHLRL
jgi:hypothetical protein